MKKVSLAVKGDGQCTGCSACTAVCPVRCIQIKEVDGFYLAPIDKDICINCGLCERICPQNKDYKSDHDFEPQFYTAKLRDKNALKSSASGGVGYALACWGIKNGYHVVGTVYNTETDRAEWHVASDKEGTIGFAGSKYIQSNPKTTLPDLNPDNKYLIIATPCQIAGVNAVISQKKYNRSNFVLVDFHCHGVPSYDMWQRYVDYVKAKMDCDKFSQVSFRDKSKGWGKFLLRFSAHGKTYFSSEDDNLFYDFYFSHSILNECCYSCDYKGLNTLADIRIGDCWSSRMNDDNEGVSTVAVCSRVGSNVVRDLVSLMDISLSPKEIALESQIAKSPKRHVKSEEIRTSLRSAMSLKTMRTLYITIPQVIEHIGYRCRQIAKCFAQADFSILSAYIKRKLK